MNSKLILIGTIMFTLVLTTGAYAYTYSSQTASATIDATPAGEYYVTYEPASEQPEWNDVLPESEYDTEILIPSGAGDDTKIDYQYPETGAHWDKVISADDFETYVYTELKASYDKDLYQLSNNVDGVGDVLRITVFFSFAGDPGITAEARAAIKTGGTVYTGDDQSQTGSTFTTRSHEWPTNPDTGEAWTWEEINALQAGIHLKTTVPNTSAYSTHVYVMVDYELPPIIEGMVPEGNIFEISPHPDYTGDMLAKIYLTNTGYLGMAYQYINMKLYVANSLEAEKTPDYQLLTMENGVALFNIEGGSSANYTVEIVGGSYRLISGNPYEWGEEWTITPEFYIEVGQRGY